MESDGRNTNKGKEFLRIFQAINPIPDLKTIIVICLQFLACFAYGQPNKSLQDSVFQKGDMIRAPVIVYGLSHPLGGEHTRDSIGLIANFLKKYPGLRVEVAVHTDSRGSYESNFHLSRFRARAVKEALIHDFRIDSSRVKSSGYGESKPIIPETQIKKAKSKEEAEKLHRINRRTELIITDVSLYSRSLKNPNTMPGSITHAYCG